MPLSIVITTVPDERHARLLAERLVDSGRAACVSFWPVRSLYVWAGRRVDAREFHIEAKTTRPAALMRLIRLHHPDQVPMICSLRAESAHPAYAAWVRSAAPKPSKKR